MTTSPSLPRSAPVEQDDLIDTLVQSTFVTMAVLNRVSAENDLSLTQLRVLSVLREKPLRMTALAGRLGLEKSTMSGLVDRAERRGLLERIPSVTDGRAVDVLLSADGAEIAERLHGQVARSLSSVTSGLTPGERRRLRTLLDRWLAGYGS